MDTSKEYIAMCEKATELQKGHNQCPHDYQYDKEQDIVFVVLNLSDAALNEPCYPMEIWLPRQDQLQEMVIHFGHGHNLSGICVGLSILSMEQGYDDCSFEQLWLAFVMKEKLDKVWDGEAWA